MTVVILTKPQWARLTQLEDDPLAKVVNHIEGCPVVQHSGFDKGRKHGGGPPRLASIAPTGRLRRIGPEQMWILKMKKTRR